MQGSELLNKVVYAVVMALVDSGALAVLRRAWQDRIIQPSRTNKDDEKFIGDAHADGWSADP